MLHLGNDDRKHRTQSSINDRLTEHNDTIGNRYISNILKAGKHLERNVDTKRFELSVKAACVYVKP